jgi:hypothetical protein
MPDLTAALSLIDTANAADPTPEDGQPAALLYGQRMSAVLAALFPEASDILQIAARGQHVERWLLPRTDYPMGKEGYYAWRKEQARRHAARVGGIMKEAGYSAQDQDRVGVLLRKEGIKRDAEVQALEDTICFVFIRWYLAAFAEKHTAEALVDIVTKTARKMSSEGRSKALETFAMPPELAAAFQK